MLMVMTDLISALFQFWVKQCIQWAKHGCVHFNGFLISTGGGVFVFIFPTGSGDAVVGLVVGVAVVGGGGGGGGGDSGIIYEKYNGPDVHLLR